MAANQDKVEEKATKELRDRLKLARVLPKKKRK